MGGGPRILTKLKEYQQPQHQYDTFGSKQPFQDGYLAGFRSGYDDASVGLEFRATERARMASAGLQEVLSPTRRGHFDEGFAGGYKSSQLRNAPVERMTSDYVEQYCRKTRSGPYSLEYCSGFGRGYMLGISSTPADRLASSQPGGR